MLPHAAEEPAVEGTEVLLESCGLMVGRVPLIGTGVVELRQETLVILLDLACPDAGVCVVAKEHQHASNDTISEMHPERVGEVTKL